MMYQEQNVISITPVSNGFIVNLPVRGIDPTSQMIDGLTKGLPMVMEKMQKDPTLSRIEDEMNEEIKSSPAEDLMRDTSTFVFETFEQVLAFLSKQYIKS